MTQYDAGPGDHSDRPWEVPDKKARPQARRRKVALPPWALLAILVGIVVLLCVGLVFLVQGLGDDEEAGTPTPAPSVEVTPLPALPTDAEPTVVAPTVAVTPTSTVVLPLGTPQATLAPNEVGPGASVTVTGTQGSGLNLRAEPSTSARVVVNVREGAVLVVVEGPQQGGGYTWWKVRTPAGQEGWGAANWLVLTP